MRECSVPGAAAAPAPPERPVAWPSRGPLAAADSPETALRLAEDHDRIAERLSDVVVRRIFSAGLNLDAALGLIGEDRAAAKVEHAISELDLAVREIRDVVFDCRRPDSRAVGEPGHQVAQVP
jgi:signal transduction histidine kinase